MAKRTRRTFDETFKRQTARRAHRAKKNPNGERLQAIALDVGITPNSLTQWMRKYPPGTPAEPEPKTTVASGEDGALVHGTNGASNGAPKMSSVRIKGLDEFIREEIREQLGPIVRRELRAMLREVPE